MSITLGRPERFPGRRVDPSIFPRTTATVTQVFAPSPTPWTPAPAQPRQYETSTCPRAGVALRWPVSTTCIHDGTDRLGPVRARRDLHA